MSIIEKSLKTMQDLSERSDVGLVGFSGGKDSLVVLDMACRIFRKVRAYHLYFVPGLFHIERQLEYARARFDVEIVQYPHFVVVDALRNAVYGKSPIDLPAYGLDDIYFLAMADAGTDFVMTGARKADSSTRRRFLGAHKNIRRHVVNPIVDWSKYDVLGYLKLRGIPIPETSKSASTGVDLSSKSLNWLFGAHPEDFEKVKEFFPYVEAEIWRQKFYAS